MSESGDNPSTEEEPSEPPRDQGKALLAAMVLREPSPRSLLHGGP